MTKFGRRRQLPGSMLALVLVLLGATLGGCAESRAGTEVDAAAETSSHPVALVYRGPGGCPSCSAAAAALLRHTKWGFQIRYVGPNEHLKLTLANLKTATLYVQPGGDGTLEQAFASLGSKSADIQSYVASGGRYLGLCMGGYLAGHDPGFDLLPGDADQFITSDGASVRSVADTIVQVSWRGRSRFMYFQDGPFFTLDHEATEAKILSTYTNSEISALVTPYGKGKVGVVGPHPEATDDWYQYNQVTDPDHPDLDLGRDLVATLMQR